MIYSPDRLMICHCFRSGKKSKSSDLDFFGPDTQNGIRLKTRFSYFFLVENNIPPQIAGITIIITGIIPAFSCCSGVGNHSNEPVNKYKSPNKKIIQIITHKNIRTVFIYPPLVCSIAHIYCMLKLTPIIIFLSILLALKKILLDFVASIY